MRHIEPRRGVTSAAAIDVPPRWGSGFEAFYLTHGSRHGLQIFRRSRGSRVRLYAVACFTRYRSREDEYDLYMLTRDGRVSSLLYVKTKTAIPGANRDLQG